MAEYETAKNINSQLSRSHGRWDSASVFRTHPNLKGDIASRVAELAPNAEPEYVTALIDEASEQVDALLFFGKRVIRVSSIKAEIEVSCWPTSQIDRVILRSAPNVLSGGFGTRSDSVALTIDVAGTFYNLPLDDGWTGHNQSSLQTFTPVLIDLVAPAI